MIRTISAFAVRRPFVVIAIWVAVVGAGFGVGIGVFERLVPDVGVVPGSESDRAEELLEETAPAPEGIAAVIVGADSTTQTSTAAAIADLRTMPGIAAVSEAMPSEAREGALLVEVAVQPGDDEEDVAEAAAERLRSIDADEVTVSGGPLLDNEFDTQAQEDVARAEIISMPAVLLLLLIVFGGLIAAGLPLLIAVVGIGATFGVLYSFSLVSDVSVYSIQVTTMLAMGLAVDYALLIVSRFREERRVDADVPGAIARTSATAGRTVMFSGLTVAIALLGLMVFNDPFLRSMGLAGSAVVLVDMVAALTLLPAVLALVGRRISPAKQRAGRGVFARVASAVQRQPVLTLLVTTAGLLVLAAPFLGMRLSMGDARMLPTSTEARQTYDALGAYYPEQNGPDGIAVVVRTAADDPAVQQLSDDIAALPEVTAVGTEGVTPNLTLLDVTTTATDDAAGKGTVTAIRELTAPVDVSVTGDAAALVDYEAMLIDRLPWAVGLVGLATLVLLFIFTGSIVLPIKAVLTNLLSISAALGVVVWVFQDGNLASWLGGEGLGYVHLTVPVLVGAIAFGLSVDYEVFLLSRIRERWLAGAGARESVAQGLQLTGGIVTAAALVIAVVFAGFMVGGFAPIKAIGLGLVLAILLDATIVRMLLVPATMTLLGRWNWWLPGPLARLHSRIAVSESVPEAVAMPELARR